MKKIYVVGIGPGKHEGMTLEAIEACRQSDVIVGYHVYVDLVKEYFPDKLSESDFNEIKKLLGNEE